MQVSSPIKASIHREGAWPEHCGSAADGCQHDRNPGITEVRHCDPQFGDSDQCSHYWRPQADEKKYAGTSSDDVGHHGCGKTQVCELDDTEANDHDCSYNALQQKADPRPTVGKRRIKSLQDPSLQIVKGVASRSKDLKVGSFFLLLGRIQLDDATPEPNGYGVGSIVGTKLRQYICNSALDGRFADRKIIGNLFICVAGCNQL